MEKEAILLARSLSQQCFQAFFGELIHFVLVEQEFLFAFGALLLKKVNYQFGEDFIFPLRELSSTHS